MEHAIRKHCEEINRCNQRGGRMLSILDLLDAEALDLDLAAWLMARIAGGDSFMIGARPGGAGKTTVMCALLNLIPPDREIVAATPESVCQAHAAKTREARCYVCHEIGSGHYFSYLWGADLRAYCALFDKGHALAANLHADDIGEAREQVCGDNGVPPAHFNRFNLLVFLRAEGGLFKSSRRIEKVYVSDGASPHSLVFDAGRGRRPVVAPDDRLINRCRAFLEENLKTPTRTIEGVRRKLVDSKTDRSSTC